MQTEAILITKPKALDLTSLQLDEPGRGDIVVEIGQSGISTGTERLLWSGEMPHFPGMGYPLVPGYESVGEVVEAGPDSEFQVGDSVFVPGAQCFGDVRGLFGGAAAHLVTDAARAIKIDQDLMRGEGVLLALAATAYHAMAGAVGVKPDLIVGHGVLGRLLARLATRMGGDPPTVWESDPVRCKGDFPYKVMHPDMDPRRDYRAIYDVSGDSALLDSLIGRLGKGGEIVLAGFYAAPLNFAFAPAFMREARIRCAAEWRDNDLHAVRGLIENGHLSLDGLLTHRRNARDAQDAYARAFGDPNCLKMVLDWKGAVA